MIFSAKIILFYFFQISVQTVFEEREMDCFQDSSQEICRDFELKENDIVHNYLDRLCDKMPLMSGCKIKELCEKNPFMSKPACHPFSILADICDKDMPRMKDCFDYNNLCKNESSVVLQCKNYPPLQALPTTKQAKDLVNSICSEMDMIGCEECRGGLNHRCDYFTTYTVLCQQMPGMQQCSSFNSMCKWNQYFDFCLDDSRDPTTDLPPTMKMFFHFSYRDYILFESWVPNGFFSYLIACIFCFSCALGYEYLLFFKAQFERRIQKQQLASYVSPSHDRNILLGMDNIEDPLLGTSSFTDTTQIRIHRGLMRCATISGAYILMLLIMSYNVGLLISVVLGLGVGRGLWGLSHIEEHCC